MIVTMARRFTFVVLFLAFAVAPLAAQKPIAASNGWIKAPAAGDTTAAAFVVVDNPTMYDVYVVSASTDVAGRVTFQRPGASPTAAADPVAQVTAPAYDSVELKPDGVHMLLSDLKKPLKPGDTVTLVLTTDSGIALEVAAEVRK
jgi:periplasmic copper chaperone A